MQLTNWHSPQISPYRIPVGAFYSFMGTVANFVVLCYNISIIKLRRDFYATDSGFDVLRPGKMLFGV